MGIYEQADHAYDPDFLPSLRTAKLGMYCTADREIIHPGV